MDWHSEVECITLYRVKGGRSHERCESVEEGGDESGATKWEVDFDIRVEEAERREWWRGRVTVRWNARYEAKGCGRICRKWSSSVSWVEWRENVRWSLIQVWKRQRG